MDDAGDFGDDRFGRCAWIGGAGDGPANNNMIGRGGDGLRWRHDPFLIADVGARRPNAGRHQQHVRADQRANGAQLMRRQDQAINSGGLRLSGAPRDKKKLISSMSLC